MTASAAFCALLLAVAAPCMGSDAQGGPPHEEHFEAVRANLYGGGAPPRKEMGAAFVDAEGRTTLTNRPERYRQTSGYREVQVEYRPLTSSDQPMPKPRVYQHEPARIVSMARQAARQHGVDEHLLLAIMKVESHFDPFAVSRRGACGLMQLMPATARELGVRDIHDPYENIMGGARYLAKLLQMFDNDRRLALAAYNAGPTIVRELGDVPPYGETQAYVHNVLECARQYAREGGPVDFLAHGRAYRRVIPLQHQKQYYMVHFKSGLKQPAEKVEEKGNYYHIQFKGYAALIRKSSVEKVTDGA